MRKLALFRATLPRWGPKSSIRLELVFETEFRDLDFGIEANNVGVFGYETVVVVDTGQSGAFGLRESY